MTTKQLFSCLIVSSALLIFSSFTATAQPSEKPVSDSTANKLVYVNPDGEETIFEKVEVEASVNVQMWRKHLEVNLLPYIERAANSKMKAGNYTVNVRFLVEKDGRITDVKALNDPGYGLAKGCERVVRTGPKWTPGELNGKKVRSYHTQPITFLIQEIK